MTTHYFGSDRWAASAALKCIAESRWFELEPQPFGMWRLTVKRNEGFRPPHGGEA